MKLLKRVVLLIFAVCLVSCGTVKKLPTQTVKEDISYEGIAADGGYLVCVVKSGTDLNSASANACRDAVYHTLFKGLVPSSGTFSQKPIIPDSSAEQKYSSFFNEFFKAGGGYTSFVKVVPGYQAVPVRTQSGYRVTVKVIVDKDALRKEMEKNGIVKSLSSGF